MTPAAIRSSFSTIAEPLPDLATVERRWRALEQVSAGSFFASWTWMGSWLRATGARPQLLSVRDGDGVEVGLALLGRGRAKQLMGRQWMISLNEAADPAADRSFIEYNAPLARAGREQPVREAIARHLGERRDWRVLRLAGVAQDEPLVQQVPSRRVTLIDRSPAYFVDLEAVRAAQGDYLSLLSANTRNQLRRSLRDYVGDQKNARPLVRRAETAAAVEDAIGEMARLNAGRHADNAWAAPSFLAFVREIALAGLAADAVEVVTVEQSAQRVGFLINFVHRGRVMNYQSAFETPISAKAKPGLMTHMAAVTHYSERGLTCYSLLAGKDRYKQSLATGQETLEWWRADRFAWRLEAEYWLRRIFRRAA